MSHGMGNGVGGPERVSGSQLVGGAGQLTGLNWARNQTSSYSVDSTKFGVYPPNAVCFFSCWS